jgi:hypothetical protein
MAQPDFRRSFSVPANLDSHVLANAILNQAGLPRQS